MSAIDGLIEQVAAIPGSEGLKQLYAPSGERSADLRRANLRRYLLDMAGRQPRLLLLFEAPGYRGCAWTGIPVTSERIMLAGIARWGLFGAAYEGLSGQPDGISEQSATILWAALEQYAEAPPLIWNTLPLHPQQPGRSQSNRSPRVSEQRLGLAALESLLAIYPIEEIGAVGRIAQRALDHLGCRYQLLRHPAQGGKTEFIAGLRGLNCL